MPKRSKKFVLNSQSRELIIRVRDFFEREAQNGGPILPVTSVLDRVADALDISKKTIIKITKEKLGETGIEDNVLYSPNKRKRAKLTDVDNFDVDAIRRHIYNYYLRKEYPTLSNLVQTLKETGLFSGSKKSLSKVLKNIGFRYKQCNKRKVLMERSDIAMKRTDFLREAKAIDDWDNVVFLDETWLNANHTVGRSWTDDTAASASKVPSGKGARLIICHAGNACGFIDNCLLAFASKTTGDYHEEMDGEKFTQWFTNMLTSLSEPSVIIMDNAPYHSMLVDKPPSNSEKKAHLVAWLQKKGVDASMSMLKGDLIRLMNIHRSRVKRYVIDELALQHGHRVLRLPPYHCEYNAIELIWAQIKGHAARHNTEPPFSTAKMMKLLEEACNHVTKNNWKMVVNKTKAKIWDDCNRDIKVDNILDNDFELVINTNDSSSDNGDGASESDT